MGGMFDNIREKAESALANHPEQVEQVSDQVIEKGGDAVDSALGGKFSSQIDAVQQAADERIGQ